MFARYTIINQQPRKANPVSRTPLPKAETNDPLVRSMRETCAHVSDAAEEANFLARPFLVLLAELLCRIFGKIEDIVLLWRAGLIPPPAPKPIHVPRHRARKRRHGKRRTRTNRRTPGFRPQRAAARRFSIDRGQPPPRKPAPVRRIDRYPKPAQKPCNPPSLSLIHFVTLSKRTSIPAAATTAEIPLE